MATQSNPVKFAVKKMTPDHDPYKFLFYGVEGIGKSTLAAAMPGAVFIPVENPRLSADAFPQPKTLEEVYGMLEEVRDYKTVVVDSVDALEGLLWTHICKKNGWDGIEGVGFGKGYNVALEEWRRYLGKLEAVWAKGINVVQVAHSAVRMFMNPEGDNYERYTTRLFETKEAKPGALIRGWCDAVFFINYETVLLKDKTKKTKAKETGARLIHTEWRASFDAKNRFNLPPTIPLSWEDLSAAIADGKRFPAKQLRESIAEKLGQLTDQAVKAKAESAFVAAGENLPLLEKIDNRLSVILA